MSALSQVYTACQTAQAQLNALWQTQSFPGQDEQMPLAEFITSSANRRGIVQNIVPGRGKVRRVELVYKQRLTEDTVSENGSNPNCTATATHGDLSKEYDMDTTQNLYTQELIDSDRWTEVCRDNGATFADTLAAHIDVLDRRVATEITEAAVLLAGTWGDGIFTTGNAVGNVNASAEFVMNTLKASSTDPNPMAWAKIRNALNKIGMGGNLFIASGDDLLEYMQATRFGCCSDGGIDVGRQFAEYGYAVARDKRAIAATALNGEDKAIAIQQGALQVLNWTKYGWKDGVDLPDQASNYFHRAITSPRLGLRYDLVLREDCGSVHITLTATTKVIGLPNDMYATGDEYAGVTKVAKLKITNS